MEQEQDSNLEQNWREEVSDNPVATLKIADKEIVFLTFNSEGKKNNHADFGDSIIFSITKDDDPDTLMNWHVNPQNFSLLKQIKELGDNITGLKVKVSREGEKKSDTRYTLEKVE